MIFHYWLFSYGFKFQYFVFNGCHDLSMLCLNVRILPSSLLIMLIIVVLCTTLVNLRQLIYQKVLSLNIVGIYIKNIVSFFYFFFTVLFSIYEMFDIMDVCKYLNISSVTVMKNPEMLKFVLDFHKSKKMCQNVEKKLSYLLRYVPDQFKTQQMCDKAILENR